VNGNRGMHCCATALLLLALTTPAWSQQSPHAPRRKSGLSRIFFPTDQDVLMPVMSVEWGVPDRWSVTSRYIHMFQKNRDHKPTLHNMTVSVAPGTAGTRVGLGYENIHGFGNARTASGASGGIVLLSEARVVMLRTWGSPLHAAAHQRFIGGELRTSLTGVVNIGVGYYKARSPAPGDTRALWGVHVGVGL